MNGFPGVAACSVDAVMNATPVIGPGDRVFVGAGDGCLYVFDPNRPVSVGANPVAIPTPNVIDSAACFVDGRHLFVPSGDFMLLGVDTEDLAAPPTPIDLLRGARWSPSPIRWLEGNIAVARDGNLLVGCDDFYMYSVDPTRPAPDAVRWGTITGSFIWSCAALSADESRIYFTSADCQLYCLERKTGRVLWRHALENLAVSSPAYVDGVVVFGGFDGTLYGVRDLGASGDRVWEAKTHAIIYASPAVASDKTIYVASADGVLRAFDTRWIEDRAPRLKWEFFLGMPSMSSALVGPDPEDREGYLVYVGGGNGQIFAIDRRGRRRYSFDVEAAHRNQLRVEDPAFSAERRCPMINASIAAGRQGLATVTSRGTIVYLGYSAYRNGLPGVETNPHDDTFDRLTTGPEVFYISPAGMRSHAPARDIPAAEVFPGEVVTLCVLARSPNDRRSTFEALDPASVKVQLDGLPLTNAGAAFFHVSADRTMVHVVPALPDGEVRRHTIALTATTDRGTAVSARFEPALRRQADAPDIGTINKLAFTIEGINVFTPFVVPALDQLGIGSIRIPMVVFATGGGGRFLAYGFESFDKSAGGSGRRTLRYLFTGSYARGHFTIEAEACHFELTAEPIGLDSLRLAGAVGTDSTGAMVVVPASLTAAYRFQIRSALAWLRDVMFTFQPAAGPAPVSWARSLGPMAAWALRVGTLLRTIFLGRPLAPWRLLDDAEASFWVGSYRAGKAPESAWIVVSAAIATNTHATRFEGTVTVVPKDRGPASNLSTPPPDPVVAVVLVNETSTQAFVTDYDRVSLKCAWRGFVRVITVTLFVDRRPPEGMCAVMFVDLAPVAKLSL